MNYSKFVFEKSNKESKLKKEDVTIEIISNYQDFKSFYNFPFQLYMHDPHWIPPFFKEYKDFFNNKNPFWTHAECKLFIAKKNNEIVGRIAAIIGYKFCEYVGEKVGYFGYFECIKDYNCTELLFQCAQDWLISKGITVMRGPINGRVDNGLGFLLEGFNSPPSVLSPYNPEYYLSFAEKFNMKKTRDLIEYHINLTKPIPDKLKEKANKCIKSGIKIRPFNRLRTKKELKWWIPLFLKTFEDHWGYVPVSEDEVKKRFGVKQLRWVVDPKLFLIAEHNKTPVAYLWSTPDYNQILKEMDGKLGPYQLLKLLLKMKKINIGKMQFISIKKDFRNDNIGSLLNYEAMVEMKRRGYIGSEVSLRKGNIVARGHRIIYQVFQ